MTNDKILGRTWEQIKAAQQGDSSALHGNLPPLDSSAHKLQIESDIARFRIPVSDEIVKAYAIMLPQGYTLRENVWCC